jgi:hypothetical protein
MCTIYDITNNLNIFHDNLTRIVIIDTIKLMHSYPVINEFILSFDNTIDKQSDYYIMNMNAITQLSEYIHTESTILTTIRLINNTLDNGII